MLQPQPQPQPQPPLPQKPAPGAHHNESRFRAYKAAACEFVNGDAYDPNQIAHMLHDLRWDEVPRAFAVALHNASRRGPIRADLEESFRGLVAYLVFIGFGSTERHIVQPWFLQNWDFYFVAMIDGLLVLNGKNATLRTRIECFRRAVYGVFDMLEVGRIYMSLDSAAESTGVHALLAACTSSKGCFIKNGIFQIYGEDTSEVFDPASRRELCLAHVLFMDMVAEAILANPNRDITTWDHAFGYYVGSDPWRDFAHRCRTYMPHQCFTKNIAALEDAVEDAHERLQACALLEKQRLFREDTMKHHQSKNAAERVRAAAAAAQGDWNARVAKRRRVIDIVDDSDGGDDDDFAAAAVGMGEDPTNTTTVAGLPDPLSPGGTFYISRAMDQGLALLRKEQREAVRRHEEALRLASSKKMDAAMNIRRDAASPPVLVPDGRPSTPPPRAGTAPLALRSERTPEEKPRVSKATRKRRMADEGIADAAAEDKKQEEAGIIIVPVPVRKELTAAERAAVAARPPLQGLPLGSSMAILNHPKFRSLVDNPRVVRSC